VLECWGAGVLGCWGAGGKPILPGQRRDFAPLLDAEAPQAVGAPEGGEALVRHAGRPGDKLQQPQPLLVVEALHRAPEPAHHHVAVMVT